MAIVSVYGMAFLRSLIDTIYYGKEVKKGETVAIIEAMKMELPVYAEEDGIVKAIICRAGQTVHSGEPLVYME